jgi:oligoendopeptidase F
MQTDKNVEFKRTFVAVDIDLSNWDALEPLFKDLLERSLDSTEDIERWLLDQSELGSCLSEEQARRYIKMTCHTEDEEAEKKYLHFVENIDPKCKPYDHKLNEKYLASPQRNELDRDRYMVLDRAIDAEIKLFRENNIPLQTETAKQSQAYQKICGVMTVQFDGKEHTMPQMARYLEETDRSRRQEAWRGITERRLQERKKIDEIYNSLIGLRNDIALNADCDDYVEYAFRMYHRFDYTPDDCFKFHQAVEECVMPIIHQLNEQRRQQLKLDALRPWDMSVDALGREPLRPFEKADEMAQKVERMIARVDPELSAQFHSMMENGELDLESRKGKAPGGYQYTLDEVRRPFIFMNAAGLQRDVETLLHESGHAFHALECRNDVLLPYRESPIEFAEVASMSMELFGAKYYEEFYTPDEANRARRKHLEGVIEVLPWIARIDAFQHWIYTNPKHSVEQRTAYWLELEKRFGPRLNWSGLEAARESMWQRQLHLFCHPFYYIEYGIAQLGALQLWKRFQENADDAIRGYRSALALGGSKPLPDLFETAGARFDFSIETIEPLMQTVKDELDKLPV